MSQKRNDIINLRHAKKKSGTFFLRWREYFPKKYDGRNWALNLRQREHIYVDNIISKYVSFFIIQVLQNQHQNHRSHDYIFHAPIKAEIVLT